MKTKIIIPYFFIIFLIPLYFTNAQDLYVYKYIGKQTSSVIKNYGRPVFRDKSNPNMDCMFYKSRSKKIVFVSDKNGVYQAEVTAFFNSKKSAKKILNKIIHNSKLNKFTPDTLSANNFLLNKTGIKVELRLTKNDYKRKYEVYLKALRN